MKKQILFFGLVIICSFQAMAQVNTEIYRPSNRNQGIVGQIKVSGSFNRGNGHNNIFLGSVKTQLYTQTQPYIWYCQL